MCQNLEEMTMDQQLKGPMLLPTVTVVCCHLIKVRFLVSVPVLQAKISPI